MLHKITQLIATVAALCLTAFAAAAFAQDTPQDEPQGEFARTWKHIETLIEAEEFDALNNEVQDAFENAPKSEKAAAYGLLFALSAKDQEQSQALVNEILAILSEAEPLAENADILYLRAENFKAQNKFAEAEALCAKALKIQREVYKDTPNHPDIAVTLNSLASLYDAHGKYAEAEPLYLEDLQILREAFKGAPNHPEIAASLNNLAKLYYNQGKYAEAETFIDECVKIYEANPNSPHSAKEYYKNRANLYYATDRPELAVADLKKAIDATLQARRKFSVDDKERGEFLAASYNLFVTMVKWQYEKLGDVEEAYLAMERSRAQAFQELLDAAQLDYLAGVPKAKADELRRADEEATAALKSLEEQIRVLQNNPNATDDDKKRLQELLDQIPDAYRRAQDAFAAIKAASPAYQMLLDKGRDPIALDVLQSELEVEKTLALEYIVGDKESYLLVFGRNWPKPKLFPPTLTAENAATLGVDEGPLDEKKIDAILARSPIEIRCYDAASQGYAWGDASGILGALENETPENNVPCDDLQNRLYALWQTLLPQEVADAVLDAEKTLILADGGLTKLPFETLIVEKPSVGKDPKYFLDCKPATVYAPSATMWHNLLARKKNAGKTLATFGNPAYGDAPTEATSRSTAAALQYYDITKLAPLPFAEAESNVVVKRGELKGFRATQFLGEAATEAAFRQAVADSKFSILHLACHGITDSQFKTTFCAGAKRAIATNWTVSDESTAVIVAQFANDAAQLRKARRLARFGKIDPRWKHPFYWAPYIMIGP